MPLWWCWWQRRLLLFCVGENVCRNRLHQICLNSYWNILSGLHLILILSSSSVSVFQFFIVSECVSDSMSVSLCPVFYMSMSACICLFCLCVFNRWSHSPNILFFFFKLLHGLIRKQNLQRWQEMGWERGVMTCSKEPHARLKPWAFPVTTINVGNVHFCKTHGKISLCTILCLLYDYV